jgi:hypothetical protein
MQQASIDLEENGYVIVPVMWMDEKKRRETRSIIRDQCRDMQEFKKNAASYVMGGFGALGNASSFHNPIVRLLRQYAMYEVVPLMTHVIAEGEQLEQLIDRLMIRTSGKSPTVETWHRDEALCAKDTDRVFGGWWNFDDSDQTFSCVAGSHKNVTGNNGFSKIKGAEKILEVKKLSIKVSVPPGHIIVFYERILHEVAAYKKKNDQYRLFLGWRLTDEESPLVPIDDILTDQGVVPLKSGQIPPMYADMHWNFWRDDIAKFSMGVDERCLETKTVKGGRAMGETHIVVHRKMKSLKDYNFQRYHPYTNDERCMHKPRQTWNVRRGSDNQKHTIDLIHETELL